MTDRVVRDELLDSERWCSCPSDTHRVVFVGLLLKCDDYGNLEGGPRRLFRWMHGFAQVKTEADSVKLMSDLQDVDLVRRYEVDGKEYWHLPRFRNRRRYWSRKHPTSPYEEQQNQPTAKNPDAGLTQTGVKPARALRTGVRRRGVGVGVGVERGGEGKNLNTLFGKPNVAQPESKNPNTEHRALALELLAFLNDKTGAHYREVAANLDPIMARLREGFTADDVRGVIAMKCRQWLPDEKMRPYLRPKTLFTRTNFANYQGAPR